MPPQRARSRPEQSPPQRQSRMDDRMRTVPIPDGTPPRRRKERSPSEEGTPKKKLKRSVSDSQSDSEVCKRYSKSSAMTLLFFFFTEVRGAASNSAYYGYPELWILRYPAQGYHVVPSAGFKPTTHWLRVRCPNHSSMTLHLLSLVMNLDFQSEECLVWFPHPPPTKWASPQPLPPHCLRNYTSLASSI
jgi:hypothetical protein